MLCGVPTPIGPLITWPQLNYQSISTCILECGTLSSACCYCFSIKEQFCCSAWSLELTTTHNPPPGLFMISVSSSHKFLSLVKNGSSVLARAVSVPVSYRSGSWLARWLWTAIFTILFHFRTQKPEVEPLSRPCWPFWGPLAVISDFWGSHRRNGWIKNLLCVSCSGAPIT